MSERPRDHEKLREIMFNIWAPVVTDHAVSSGYPTHTVEQILKTYGGQPPDPGFPPDWDPAAVTIEHAVTRLPSELRAAVLIEFGLVRDAEGNRLKALARCKALHVSRSRYYYLVSGAMAALCESAAIRELIE